MPLVGIIAKKRDIQAIKKELAEYEVEIIHLNKEALKNMKNIIELIMLLLIFLEYLIVIIFIYYKKKKFK